MCARLSSSLALGHAEAMSLPDRHPRPTVDIIIEMADGRIVLIERRFPPPGWAIPGGFVDYGETLETAAMREAREETNLEVELLGQLKSYSDPRRDSRLHTITTVFIARGRGEPRAQDDAANIGLFAPDAPPSPLAFDHGQILADYRLWRGERWRLGP
jgi:8-oxo-dGTP diphosphatase